MLRTLTAKRYVVPLREGGSLPAIVEADDGQLYVMKFVGAGQGAKALIAELVAGEIGRLLGLNVPEIVLLEMSPLLGRSEPNPEIQMLLRASAGLNLGLRYLDGAFEFNQLLAPPPNADLASSVVWFDAYVTNVDRTNYNVNLLLWRHGLWLIDHGAALYVHHDWRDYQERSRSAFPMVRQHTLLPLASQLPAADARLRPLLNADSLAPIVDAIPAQWLAGDGSFASAADHRATYLDYLLRRSDVSAIFVEEALRARAQLV